MTDSSFLYYIVLKKIMSFYRANDKTDLDVIRENHRFLWNEEDETDMNWYLELLQNIIFLEQLY